MADAKISQLGAGSALATGDLIPIVDVSDTTMAASGTTKAYPLSVFDARYSASVPTAITVASEESDTTCFPLFVTAANGNLGPKTNAGFTFDAPNQRLAVSSLVTTDPIVSSGLQFNGTTGGNITNSDDDTIFV